MRFTGVLEKLYNEEAVAGHSLNRLDEIGSQVQPVAGFLVLASPYEGLELRVLLARREASFKAIKVCASGKTKIVRHT